LAAGSCTVVRWQTSNVKSVRVDGEEVQWVGEDRTCPCFDETHVLDVTLLDDSHDIRYLTIDVTGRCPTPTARVEVKRARTATPEPSPSPTSMPSSGDITDPSRPRSSTLEGTWAQAVNLSLSGAASKHQIVAAPDGRLWAFWWDEFNGLVATSHAPDEWGSEDGWSAPVVAPIVVTKLVGEGKGAEWVSNTVGEMPSIVGAGDYAHAFWIGEADEDTGLQPLMHSRLALGAPLGQSTARAWSGGEDLAETALLWRMTRASDGALHLVYVRPVHSEALPAGIYHRRSLDNGASWGPPTVLYGDIYYRRLSAEEAHLTVAADGEQRVFVTWDDPRLESSFMAVSVDGGATWAEPRQVPGSTLQEAAEGSAGTSGETGEGVRRARVVPTGDDVLLLWEEKGAAPGCVLHQQRLVTATEALPAEWSAAQRVLEELTACPATPAFLQTAGGDPLMLIGSGGETLTAVAWRGPAGQPPATSPESTVSESAGITATGQVTVTPGWSEPKSLTFSFQHPELDRQVYLDQLRATLADGSLVVVGLGQHGDVWYLESAVDTWEWAFAPPPAWAGPVNISQSAGRPGMPSLAADAEGRVHAIWSEATRTDAPGTAIYYARLEARSAASQPAPGGGEELSAQWSRPEQVLQSPDGRAEQPALVSYQDLLYAVWIGGQGDRIYASQAYARDAYAPDGWSAPQEVPLGGVTASSPRLLVDAYGLLHVVYAAPLNEDRGIYYTSADASSIGLTGVAVRSWSEPQVVFDAAAAGWPMVDHPALAMDPGGTLHVAWVRGSSDGPFGPQGVFYARSADGGKSWSEARQIAEGAYAWPQVAAPLAGQVHLLWNDADGGDAWTHRWTADYGETWSYQQQVRGLRDVPGPVGLAVDGVGGLYLVGLGRDDFAEPALLYSVWRPAEERWEAQDPYRVGQVQGVVPGVALALLGADGRLDAAFRADVPGEEGTRREVLHARRSIPAVEQAPEPFYTPVPTMTPLPSPTPTATATPRPQVDVEPPRAAPPTVGLGPVTLPVIALAGLGLALAIILAVLMTRRRGR
jgi:hypothetical protein